MNGSIADYISSTLRAEGRGDAETVVKTFFEREGGERFSRDGHYGEDDKYRRVRGFNKGGTRYVVR